MKITVIGGSGLIGKKLVEILCGQGHKVLPASPSTGVNTLTGEGLTGALAGAAVVVDVSNAPSWEDDAVMEFFTAAGRNILAAEAVAGVGHHVALSVVGTDRLQASGYFRAKLAQENVIQGKEGVSPLFLRAEKGDRPQIPYTIVRATQFFEFVGAIADSGADGNTIRLPPATMQPIAAADVAAILADVATGKPLNRIIDIAGPEPIRMDDLVRQYLAARRDSRQVITDPTASYYGLSVNDQSLVPTGPNPRLGRTRFADWLAKP